MRPRIRNHFDLFTLALLAGVVYILHLISGG